MHHPHAAGRSPFSSRSIVRRVGRPASPLASAARSVVETLEGRRLMAAAPVITEFVASNGSGLVDGNGAHSDWIEIQNGGDAPIDLAGWHLSDNASNLDKWTFPSRTLAAGAYLVIFADSATASGPDSLGYLHTNFSLSADGENLSLSNPAGTVVSQFGDNGALYPAQTTDVSYGLGKIYSPTTLITANAPAKAVAPTTNALDGSNAWTLPGYVDTTWKSGTLGVGYDGGGTSPVTNLLARWYAPSLALADDAPVATWTAASGTGTANSQNPTSSRPTYQSDAASEINGHPVVHFDGINDQLRVTNQTLSGATNFTVAVVFRTSTPGRAGTTWYNNTGIVSADSASSSLDWGINIDDGGSVAGGVDDTTLYSDEGNANGLAHVAILTKSGTTTSLSVDGGLPVNGAASAAARVLSEMAFGTTRTTGNFFNGDIGEVRLYNAALSADAVRSLSGEIGTAWGIPQAGGVYTPQIGLDLQAEMAGLARTAAVRVPFTATDTSAYNTAVLNMKYDDGFVAYLNGVEVARRNAPAGSITYLSTATAERTDAAAQTAEAIDISSFANLIHVDGTQNVLAIRAINVSATDSDLLVAPTLVAGHATLGPTFMTTPTPGAANAPGFAGLVAPVTVSVPHGYYTAAVSPTLTTATAGATIVYTTDGSTPTLTNGTKVLPANATVAPTVTLNIAATTTLRAIAFKDGYLAGNVVAASYLFVNDIIRQPEYKPAGAYWDVGMDQSVVNAQQTYTVQQALLDVPTVSLTIDSGSLFDPATGIYTNPLQKGDAWEREGSVEYFDPRNPASQFTANAGLRIVGAVSRNTDRPKKGFKLYFRSEYGNGKLNFPIFGSDNPQQSLDHLTLRAGHNYTWANGVGLPVEQSDYLRDQFARDTQLALTGHASRGSFVQVYINGQYWGLYNAAEDVDATWAAANYGGASDDYDVVKPDDSGGIAADDGDLTAWNKLFADADAAAADGNVSAAEYTNLASQVDTKELVDYMLNSYYRGDQDSPVLIGSTTSPRNFIAVHNRVAASGKFTFEQWDGEFGLSDATFDRTALVGNQNPARLFSQLKTNSDFRQLVIDEYTRTFGRNGALSVPADQARYKALMTQIDKAIVGESARWGNARQTTVGTRDNQWVTETGRILNGIIPQRFGYVVGQIRNVFPELNTVPPIARIGNSVSYGGTIAAGTAVTLLDGNITKGKIYYTLDGTDPRAGGGAIASTSLPYGSPITLGGARTIQARTLKGGVWSALTTLAYTVAPPSLRLSELMYHPTVPAGGTYAKDEYEFIEVTNTGATPIDLSGMTLNTGAAVGVPTGTTLAAGKQGIFVKNVAAFQQRYGTAAQILGTYTDYLSNSGERVTLYDPNSATNVFDVTYVDSWYPTTDGNGYSLVVKDLAPSQAAATVLGVATAWRASTAAGGSPGAADPVAAAAQPAVAAIDWKAFSAAFGSNRGDATYNVLFDADHDGAISILDFNALASIR